MSHIFSHNNRTYWDIYNQFVSAYPHYPDWLFNDLSGMFEVQAEYQNAVANDIFEPSTRESAYAYAADKDYTPVEASGCTTIATITLTGTMAKTLLSGYQIGGISAITGKLVIFELDADTSSGATDTITGNFTQQSSFTNKNIGTVNSSDAWSEYDIEGYTNIVKSTAELTIESLTWSRVDNFDDSESTDKHFQLLYKSNGKSFIRFGNGTRGLIPTLAKVITADFAITEGLSGVMDAATIINNVGADSDISTVTNAAATSGGNNAETVSSIVRNARANIRYKDIVWSEDDIETNARASSSSVVKALGVGGEGTAVAYIVPSTGGVASDSLLAIVKAYEQSKSQFGIMPFNAYSATYSSQNITATASIRTGFTSATVLDLVEFALTLCASAIDVQVIDSYEESGITIARALINTLYTFTFTSDEDLALVFIINKWVDLLGTRDYREFEQELEVGDLWIMGNSLYDYGVDEFNLVSPTTNQDPGSGVIIDSGTIAVT